MVCTEAPIWYNLLLNSDKPFIMWPVNVTDCITLAVVTVSIPNATAADDHVVTCMAYKSVSSLNKCDASENAADSSLLTFLRVNSLWNSWNPNSVTSILLSYNLLYQIYDPIWNRSPTIFRFSAEYQVLSKTDANINLNFHLQKDVRCILYNRSIPGSLRWFPHWSSPDRLFIAVSIGY